MSRRLCPGEICPRILSKRILSQGIMSGKLCRGFLSRGLCMGIPQKEFLYEASLAQGARLIMSGGSLYGEFSTAGGLSGIFCMGDFVRADFVRG